MSLLSRRAWQRFLPVSRGLRGLRRRQGALPGCAGFFYSSFGLPGYFFAGRTFPPYSPVLRCTDSAPPRLLVEAPSPDNSWPGWFRRNWPTAAVFALLGGLAYYGHATGWTIPKFSELTGNGADANLDWCKEHSVPESVCVECNEAL